MNPPEFYLGYEPQAPPGLARRMRVLLAGLALALPVLAGLLAAGQRPADPGVFEFGVVRSWEGVLEDRTLPLLRVEGSDGPRSYLLVSEGKFGPPEVVHEHAGERVRFRGTLIRKGAASMIEMNDPASFTMLARRDAVTAAPAPRMLGRVRLEGELVDTKCHLGVMRPGDGKVHRGCAVRCLSGGVPPGLLVRDAAGEGRVVLLAGEGGGRLKFDPEWAARVVSAEGRLVDDGGVLVLETAGLSLRP